LLRNAHCSWSVATATTQRSNKKWNGETQEMCCARCGPRIMHGETYTIGIATTCRYKISWNFDDTATKLHNSC
jgi:hypothetical protein